MAKFSEKSMGLKTRHYSRRWQPVALGKIRTAWTKTGPGYWDWGPEVALVEKLVAAPVEARVAKWASDLVGRVVVKQWEKVPESHIRRPTHSQERMRKKESACSVRNDGWG